MTAFDRVLALVNSPDPVAKKAIKMIGEGEAALILAKGAIQGTSVPNLKSDVVSEALGVKERQARERISDTIQ